MEILRTIDRMRSWSRDQEAGGHRIALVPTMGYFHEGHLSLMRTAAATGARVVVSLFVNPIQFGPNEDLESYPRDFDRDAESAARAGAAVLFAPGAEEMYPDGFQTSVTVDHLTRPLCGRSRPGHFSGVTTVVCKLFNIVRPHLAVFGRKDYQQLAVVRRMVRDLNMDVEIIAHPIVREEDGLAMSSRNSYLDSGMREKALCLVRGLDLARSLFRAGERDPDILIGQVEELIRQTPDTAIDYVSLVDPDTLHTVNQAQENSLLALAVVIGGRVRLIDNTVLGEQG